MKLSDRVTASAEADYLDRDKNEAFYNFEKDKEAIDRRVLPIAQSNLFLAVKKLSSLIPKDAAIGGKQKFVKSNLADLLLFEALLCGAEIDVALNWLNDKTTTDELIGGSDEPGTLVFDLLKRLDAGESLSDFILSKKNMAMEKVCQQS